MLIFVSIYQKLLFYLKIYKICTRKIRAASWLPMYFQSMKYRDVARGWHGMARATPEKMCATAKKCVPPQKDVCHPIKFLNPNFFFPNYEEVIVISTIV